MIANLIISFSVGMLLGYTIAWWESFKKLEKYHKKVMKNLTELYEILDGKKKP